MTVTINGTTGITNDGGYTGDGVVFADTTPANTLVTTTGGNVGVGTASPTDIAGYNSVTVASTTGGWVEVTNGTVRGVLQNGSGDVTLETRSAHPLIFGINGSEKGRFDTSGRFLINATGAFGSGQNIQIGSGALDVGTSYKALANGNWAIQFFNTSSSTVGQIVINSGSVSYNSASDYRLKHDIQPMTGALAKVAQLKPVTYKWNSDNSESQGFIAHELAEVCPDAVTGNKDAIDDEGNPKYQGIDTSFLVATLTAAIQEQQALIQSLTDRITALETA